MPRFNWLPSDFISIQEDDLYDKIPSYLTVFSHSTTTPIKDHNDVLNDYIVNYENCDLKRNLYSLPNFVNCETDEYCRLPAYTMDLSQSLLYDQDFGKKINICKSDMPPLISVPKRFKRKLLKIEKESIDNRKVVFLANLPVNWVDARAKIERILDGIDPPVKCFLRQIDVKNRFHNNLDSYAFIHFTESKAAFDTLECNAVRGIL